MLYIYHPLVCSYYAQGPVKAVNEVAQVKLLKGMCEGDEFCEFESDTGYKGKGRKDYG
nr:hypothetical protein BSM_02800 [uncultured archaeon]